MAASSQVPTPGMDYRTNGIVPPNSMVTSLAPTPNANLNNYENDMMNAKVNMGLTQTMVQPSFRHSLLQNAGLKQTQYRVGL